MNIYTTGAFLVPQEITTPDGITRWVWVVNGFEEDSFNDGETFNPPETADTEKELTTPTDRIHKTEWELKPQFKKGEQGEARDEN